MGFKEMPPKDPDSTLRYDWDWGPWLEGATITSFAVTTESAHLVVENSSLSGGSLVSVVVSGGSLGDDDVLECRIETSDGRIDVRSMTIPIRNR